MNRPRARHHRAKHPKAATAATTFPHWTLRTAPSRCEETRAAPKLVGFRDDGPRTRAQTSSYRDELVGKRPLERRADGSALRPLISRG